MVASLFAANQRLRGSASWLPTALFTAGEQGVWYDPSDLTSMRQLSTGATAAAVGSPVGFMADKRLMGGKTFDAFVAGQPDIVVNGDFSVDANWVKVNGATISGGTLNLFNAVTNPAATQTINATIGWAYYVEIEWTGTLTAGIGNYGSGDGRFLTGSTAGSFAQVVPLTAGTGINIWLNAPVNSLTTVDRVLIKAIPGNHATQSNAAQRPTYGVVPAGGRRNLLTFTEQFDNAVWVKSNATVTANARVAPDGTMTADALFETIANNIHQARQAQTIVSGSTYTFSAYVKANGRTRGSIFLARNSSPFDGFNVIFDLTAVSVTTSVNGTGTITNSGITSVGDGWFRVFGTGTTGTFTAVNAGIQISDDAGASTYVGDPTKGLLIWGAQLELGSAVTAYQRVGTAFDVTEAGVASRPYLSFDGTDDGMLTGNIVPGTDKAQVFAGVRKLSATTFGMAVDFGNLGVGSLALQAPGGVADNYEYQSGGSIGQAVTATGYTAPITNVVTGTGDIAGDSVILRANGVQVASSALDQGTGNYSTTPLYIGRRAGASRAFNGQIFGLIVRFGTNLSAATVTQTETWLANRAAPTVVIP